MKTELKAKFLQHLVQKKQDKGFTLIELLVVIIIIGILSAIALPSFLNQAAKAKQTEAKNYVGSTNRAQQAYRIEKPKFAATWSDLEIGIPDKTQDYTYTLGAGNETTATVTAEATDPSLKDYTGGVVVLKDSGQTSVGACQTKKAGQTAVLPTLSVDAGASCGGNSEPMR